MESDDLFEETETQQTKRREAERYVEQYAERDWGLAARQRRVQGTDKDMVTENALELRVDSKIVFMEKQGQQAKVWDCALVLAKFLANEAFFPKDFFVNKHVIELGCGIGVPGLAAAALGAKEVVLTDMPLAVPWIEANIKRNQTLGCISSSVHAQGLMWGEQDELESHQFDVILCSDLVYGHRDISHKLVQTIVQLSHPNTLIISAHEARFAGDRGESFFALLSEQHFEVEQLAEDGYIKPHVDSIKFSGRVVAGINLLSPSIMRFKEEHGDSVIDAYLQRRSMYMMTGRVRYHYTHEILPGAQVFRDEIPVNRTHRISIMLRDEFLEEHVAKYHTPFAKPDVETQGIANIPCN
ncbi:Hypothetical protein PHPALM_17273 [Phytophthora palmivora]|uniref:Alpha-ketoglutarate-dependent dioxygenase AlkB-like domain-containing protein n=1 Tax=Phytophthora palmivora TaxID=4796 RepID=A0A2P4XMM1_9STRA|nr:Hypothetical protein PHPALM_17273 [Phytophthora palmivora]